ncbi:uncharacterized protein LOC116305828 [Actinia tenebrosa]|uniref:Uncharacterized protein LOC116305828 n=1 Tax=Actinia tenebrosa TaxID=6105 RepID=A0A6P8IWB3_ACTTE|nr:uncharacterized protein LOC116305828 [Actinia tenebrosa]
MVKGMCHVLDYAQAELGKTEKLFSWADRAVSFTTKNMLFINKLSFSGKLTASFDATQMLSVDLTLFDTNLNFDLKIDLKNILSSAKDLAVKALWHFIERYSFRITKAIYGTPSDKSDYQLSGEMKIVSMDSNECLAAVVSKDRPLYTDGCDKATTVFAYTMAGAIMNIQSGLCLTFKGMMNKFPVQLDECSIASDFQKFDCTLMTLRPKVAPDMCLSISGEKQELGNWKSIADHRVLLHACDASSNAQKWKVHGDMKGVSVCERFVVDIALNGIADQSSRDEDGYGPHLAIDGDLSSSLKGGSCILTSNEKDPWWIVDLRKEHLVTDVSIVGESDHPDLELTSIEVRVGNLRQASRAFMQNPMCGDRLREIQDGEVWTSQCWPYIAGRFVSVQKIGIGKLSMCEVAVFARLDKQGKCVDEVRRKRNEAALYSPGL